MPTATNQDQSISLATWLKMRFRGHLLHLQAPTFCGFHPSELPKRTPRPQYPGPLGCGKLQAQAQTGGCPNGSTGSNRGKKMTFLKNDPTPCATLKQVFLGRLELVVAHFGPPKIPKCLKNALFWDQKWVQNGSKRIFSRLILDHLGCTNMRNEPILRPIAPTAPGCVAVKGDRRGASMGGCHSGSTGSSKTCHYCSRSDVIRWSRVQQRAQLVPTEARVRQGRILLSCTW